MKKKNFSWFLQSKHVFFDFCSSPAAKNWWFQILVASSRCPQNRKNLKIDILPQKYRECSGDAFFFFFLCFGHWKVVFWSFFGSRWGDFDAKTSNFTYFWCFLTILQGLDYLAACTGRAWVWKNRKKSKSQKITLNTPKLT